MNNSFTKIMEENTDAQLLAIVYEKRLDYQVDAVIAAEKEIKRRNLSANQFDEAKSKIIKTILLEKEKENKPLPIVWKVLTTIYPGIIQFIIAYILKEKGYKRMAKDLVFWTSIGILIVLTIILTIKILF